MENCQELSEVECLVIEKHVNIGLQENTCEQKSALDIYLVLKLLVDLLFSMIGRITIQHLSSMVPAFQIY